jgi:nicotinate-nucleotide pyrophosphorylase
MIQNTLTKFSVEKVIQDALYEDLGQNGDITSNSIIDIESEDSFYMTAREEGTVSGIFLALSHF